LAANSDNPWRKKAVVHVAYDISKEIIEKAQIKAS